MKFLLLGSILALAGASDTPGSRPYLTDPSVESLTEVAILSPVPLTGGWVGGHTMRIAAEIAKDIINSQQKILPGYRLSIHWRDDTCNANYGVQTMLEEWVSDTKWVALGANGCSAVCMATAIVTTKIRIPQISYGCASGSISNTATYPDMTRFMTVENTMADVFKALGTAWGWSKIQIIAGNPLRFDAPSQYLMDYFANEVIRTEWEGAARMGAQPPWEDVLTLMNKYKAAQQRVFVVLGYEPFYRQIVCGAYKVGIPKGIVWLSVGWHKSGWYNEFDDYLMNPTTGVEPECDVKVIGDYYLGGIGAAGLGKPAASDMDTPLPCFDNQYTASQLRDDVITPHFTKGYPIGENIVVGDPYWGIMANGADGMCVWAYMVKHMFGKGYALTDLQRPAQNVYDQMIHYIKKENSFRGAGGLVNFEGNDLPGILAVYQVQRNDQGALAKVLVATVDLQKVLAKVPGTSYIFADGSSTPGSVFRACSPGSFLDIAGNCQKCGAGTYHDCGDVLNGECTLTKNCIPCPKAFSSSTSGAIDLASCSACTTGKFGDTTGATACTNCDPGKFAASITQTECASCVAGEFAGAEGLSTCDRCAQGTYSDQEQTSVCIACGAGLETKGVGSREVGECICREATYEDSGSCKDCPVKMECLQGSTKASLVGVATGVGPTKDVTGFDEPYPTVMPGFWTPKDEPLSVYRCNSDEQCIGGAPGACATDLEGQACSKCKFGLFWDGKKCMECSDIEMSSILFPILPALITFGIVCFMYKISGDRYEKWNSWRNQIISVGFLTLNHYQVLSIIRNVNLNLHIDVKLMFKFWSFTEDLLSMFKLACTGFGTFESSMIMKSAAPLYLVLVTILTVGVSHVIANITKKEEMAFDKNRAMNMFLSLILTFFNGIAGLSFSLFKCVQSPNEIFTMKQYPEVTCYAEKWNALVVVGVLSVLIYCVGFGFLFLYAITIAPKKFGDRNFQMRWKFLFIKFRTDVHWWAAVIIMRGLFLNIGFIAFTFGLAQLYWIMCLEAVYMGLTIAFLPWRFRFANFLSIATSMSIIFSSALNAIYVERTETLDNEMAWIIMILSCLPLVLALSLVGRVLYTQIPSKKASDAAERVKEWKLVSDSATELSKVPASLGQELYAEMLTQWDQWYLKMFVTVVRAEFLGLATAGRTVSSSSQDAIKAKHPTAANPSASAPAAASDKPSGNVDV